MNAYLTNGFIFKVTVMETHLNQKYYASRQNLMFQLDLK